MNGLFHGKNGGKNMKKIQVLEMSVSEFAQILQTLTDNGKLKEYEGEDDWEHAINSTFSVEEVIYNKPVREEIAKHLGVSEIRYHIKDEDTIILI